MSYAKIVMIPVDVYRNILGEKQISGNKESLAEPPNTEPPKTEPPKTEPQQVVSITKKIHHKVKKIAKKARKEKPSNNYKRRKGKKFIRSILKNMSKRQLSTIASHRQ